MRLFAPLFLAAALWSCASPDPTYESDVRPLVEAHCQTCHSGTGIGPFPLNSYEDVAAMAAPMRNAIEKRTMPPYLASPGCAEYADDLTLTDAQIQTFGRWVDVGMPRGTASGTKQAVETAPGLDRVDATLQLPTPYVPDKSPDDYRCFLVDWSPPADTYVVGLNVAPGNARVVHHVIAYLVPPDRLAAVQALDDAEAGPGYTCFGGPGFRAGWLGAWAPGGQGGMYPPDTGVKVPAGSKVVLQMHYNTQQVSGPDAVDQTKVELALASSVRKRSFILPWANPDWVQKRTMNIPAYQPDVVHSYAFDPTPYMGAITGGALPSSAALKVYSATLHQHQLGTKSRLEIERDSGDSTCLLDIQRWDFHWQRSYPFTQAKVLRPGERVKLTCHFDNSQEHQPWINGAQALPRDVNWGEGTGDEMCLGILYLSE